MLDVMVFTVLRLIGHKFYVSHSQPVYVALVLTLLGIPFSETEIWTEDLRMGRLSPDKMILGGGE